jgi:hypothetical protein
MKILKLLFTGLIATVVSLSTPSPVHGQEQSAKVINDLLKSVDTRLLTLEKTVEERNKDKLAIEQEKVRAVKTFEQNTNSTTRLEAQVDLVNVLVRENAQDRAIVKEMKETVSGVLIDLTEIQQNIAKSPFSPAALQIQRERLVNVLKNAGPILQVIQNSTEDTNSVNRAKSTEALLVLYYKQLSSWPKSNANPAKDIAQTAEMLGNVAIELKVLEGLLEREKQLLTDDVYRHLAKAITGRIRSTNLGQRDLNGMKNDLMKNAVDRRRNYGRILDSDSDSPGLQTAEQDSVILEQIRRGRLPENP